MRKFLSKYKHIFLPISITSIPFLVLFFLLVIPVKEVRTEVKITPMVSRTSSILSTPTKLPLPTKTATSLVTKPSLIKATSVPIGKKIFVKISHYTPWVGGVNCARFVNGKCISKMASGLPWENYLDIAIACPKELPFYSKIILDGKTWTCLDRGGKIIFDGKTYWIDMLTAKTTYPFGSIKEATLILP